MSAVGFDIRNTSCVVAVAKHSGIWCFSETQRFLETNCTATGFTTLENSISQIIRLIIGRPFSDPDLQQDLKSLPFSVTEGRDGSPLIHALCSETGSRSFTPIQVLAMVLSRLKKLAEQNLNAAVVDCCIGIPIYFTDLQRRAVMDAATLAGLNPLRLMHETTATALAYGIYQPNSSENSWHYVAFVDIGHVSMQVCIAEFRNGEMRILAHSFDRYLGEKDFDEVLFQHFAEKFKSGYKIDVFLNADAFMKLRFACERLKKALRSNPKAPLYVECLIDNQYVRGFIKRDEYEQTSSMVRLKDCLRKALSDAKLTVDHIHALEFVGSDSWVIKILTEFFRKEPRGIMNANECVSRGCALQCAILSPNFKVREFQVQDIFPFPITLEWKRSRYGETNNLESCIVLPRGNPIPGVNSLTFDRSCTFTVDVQYKYPGTSQAPTKIDTFTIGPFQSVKNGLDCKVELQVALDLNGCASVNSAQLIGKNGISVPISLSRVEPLKETIKIVMKRSLTDVEVYECLTLPKT